MLRTDFNFRSTKIDCKSTTPVKRRVLQASKYVKMTEIQSGAIPGALFGTNLSGLVMLTIGFSLRYQMIFLVFLLFH